MADIDVVKKGSRVWLWVVIAGDCRCRGRSRTIARQRRKRLVEHLVRIQLRRENPV